jgi:hypothetical protein
MGEEKDCKSGAYCDTGNDEQLIPGMEDLHFLTASDIAGRHVPRLAKPEEWEKALSLLVRSSRIAMVTGFMVPSANAPETDGPPGTIVLARALVQCGKKVTVYTDPLCQKGVMSCGKVLGFSEVRAVEKGTGIHDEEPDLLFFVERLGRTRDGRYCNMHGMDISDYTYPLDEAAIIAMGKKIPVIAIGDGGNEVGMGLIAEKIHGLAPAFSDCVCSISCDVLLASDVSNWGAYGLTSILSSHYGRWLGHSASEEKMMLDAMIEAGAVDGVSGLAAPSVDGFSLEKNMEMVDKFYSWYLEHSREDREDPSIS